MAVVTFLLLSSLTPSPHTCTHTLPSSLPLATQRYFVLEKGIMVCGRSPSHLEKDKLICSIDMGTAVVSFRSDMWKIDIDGEHQVLHLKVSRPSCCHGYCLSTECTCTLQLRKVMTLVDTIHCIGREQWSPLNAASDVWRYNYTCMCMYT